MQDEFVLLKIIITFYDKNKNNNYLFHLIVSLGILEDATLVEGSDGTMGPNTGVTQNSETGM